MKKFQKINPHIFIPKNTCISASLNLSRIPTHLCIFESLKNLNRSHASMNSNSLQNPSRIPRDHCIFESLQNSYDHCIFETLQNTYRYPASLNAYRIHTDIQHLWMPTEYLQISSIFESLQNRNRKCTESFKKPHIFKSEFLQIS